MYLVRRKSIVTQIFQRRSKIKAIFVFLALSKINYFFFTLQWHEREKNEIAGKLLDGFKNVLNNIVPAGIGLLRNFFLFSTRIVESYFKCYNYFILLVSKEPHEIFSTNNNTKKQKGLFIQQLINTSCMYSQDIYGTVLYYSLLFYI